MKNIENNKYIIKEDYHGDIKLIKNNTKKVDLSKPTDILDHRVKPKMMPTIYTNSNPPQKIKHYDKKICLTKPEDIVTKEKKSLQAETLFKKALEEEQSKKHQKKIDIYLIITVLVSLIPIVAYVVNTGLEFRDTLTLLILPTILICQFTNNKK